jgi:hypothetical protein
MDEDDAKLEAEIAVVYAKLCASSWLRDQKEPYDTPVAMTAVAYGMLQLLVDAAGGSGREHDWHQFLAEALQECISKSDALDGG